MSSWTAFLITYLLGGLTFIPLVILTVLLHAHLTFPTRKDGTQTPDASVEDDIVQPGDDVEGLKAAEKEDGKSRATSSDSDVAAGYFAVCREYTPMGINAKPIERSTPVGSTTVTAPSPSVYQTMYRSLFDRNKSAGPLDNQNNSQRPKKAGNVFYVVLRHGHLMLFDDDEQLEVRHVISLAHHHVSIYSGGDKTPEGELFIKRNAICLARRSDGGEVVADTQLSKPFFLFSENSSAKEDFYFALLRSQQQSLAPDGTVPPPLAFDIKHIISLVQRLHSSEEHQNTRWLNAMIGRVFLGLYKTKDMENLIREKLTKKISRVKRPSFLSNITIQRIDTGESAPYFTNPRLKDLTVEGECGMEVDVRYTGKFLLEVAATARIELGSRLKAREVSLVLAVVVKKLEGHVHFKIKPPPSNRIWFSFQAMPKMEMTIEPIVSSRQITYNVILRQIEARIKEVIAETLVLPFWDDVPFFKTEHKTWRGGIFQGDDAVESTLDPETALAQEGDVDDVDELEGTGALDGGSSPPTAREKSHSLPALEAVVKPGGFFGRKKADNNSNNNITNHNNKNMGTLASSASTSTTSVATSVDTRSESIPERRAARRSSFIHSPTPTTGTDSTNAEAVLQSPSSPSEKRSSALVDLVASQRATGAVPVQPTTNPYKPYITSKASSQSSLSSKEVPDSEKDIADNDANEDLERTPQARRGTASSSGSHDDSSSNSPSMSIKGSMRSQTGSLTRGLFGRKDDSPQSTMDREQQRKNAIAAVTNVAASAKRWGLNALQRNNEGPNHKNGTSSDSHPAVDLKQPMGRGQPLPPPGTPLPMPERKTKTAPAPKRKPVLPPFLEHHHHNHHNHNQSDHQPKRADHTLPPPPLPKRRSQHITEPTTDDSGMLVVAAPADSEPSTPMSATHVHAQQGYFKPTVEDDETDGGEVRRVGLDLVSPTRVSSRTESLPEEKGAGGGGEKEEDDYSAWLDGEEGPDVVAGETETNARD